MDSELLTEDTSKLFYRYLFPSIGGALVTSIYSFVDTIAVGQACGPEGSAAIATINPIFAVAAFLGVMLGVGGSVEISRSRGAGDSREAKGYFTVSFLSALLSAALFWLLSALFLTPLLRLSGADDVILPYARAYAVPIIASFPLLLLNSYLSPVIRSDENPSLPLKGVIVGGVFNMLGDWLFVFPLGMGMAGAGLATALGIVLHSAVMLTHFRTKDKERTSLVLVKATQAWRKLRKVVSSGFAASLSDISLFIITILMNQQAMRYGGRNDLAVFGVIITISFLLQHVFLGVGQAAVPVTSANYGAGKKGRVWESFRYLLFWAFLLGLATTLVCLLLPEPILRLFMDTTPEVMAIGPGLIRLYSLSFLLLSVNSNLVLFLQAVQRPALALLISLSRTLAVNGLLLVLLPPLLGSAGICWAMTAAEVVTVLFALPCTLRLRRESWHNGGRN